MSFFDLELSQRKLDGLEEKLRSEEKKLDEFILKKYRRLYADKVKDPDTFATLTFCLGLGIHHIYLGKFFAFLLDFFTSLYWIFAVFTYAFVVSGFNKESVYIFIFCITYSFLDWVVCLFFSQRIVRKHNIKIGYKLIKSLK
jgi:hypothetical protein